MNTDESIFLATPTMIQPNIKKMHELRIQNIGNEYYTFKIDSQEYLSTSTDWRVANQFLEFHYIDLEDDLRAKLDLFMKKTGFKWGSIDIIVDCEGRHWFLECNPMGQWAWLDDIVGGAISKAYACLLIDMMNR